MQDGHGNDDWDEIPMVRKNTSGISKWDIIAVVVIWVVVAIAFVIIYNYINNCINADIHKL